MGERYKKLGKVSLMYVIGMIVFWGIEEVLLLFQIEYRLWLFVLGYVASIVMPFVLWGWLLFIWESGGRKGIRIIKSILWIAEAVCVCMVFFFAALFGIFTIKEERITKDGKLEVLHGGFPVETVWYPYEKISFWGRRQIRESGENPSAKYSGWEMHQEEDTLNEKYIIDIQEHYITNTGNPSNLYHIDEENVLWGCGENQYGQLGQGTRDEKFHEEMVKIAEDVVHVDFSQKGFVIYLTRNQELYGFGNGSTGVLRTSPDISFEGNKFGEESYITEPVFLMGDVAYARCGREDMVVLTTDSNVWIWGIVWAGSGGAGYYQVPTQVLEGAVLVTGGMYNHAALLEDGSVWTWGYNYSGNCGIETPVVLSVQQKLVEDVVMVWTDRMEYNTPYMDIEEIEGYEKGMENTIIQKRDGSYWICGAYVGEEEKVLSPYYEAWEFIMVCTYEFLPYDRVEK